MKEDFNIPLYKGVIQFGGRRAKGAMWKQFVMPLSPKYKDTWKVAANELTWLIRGVGVESKASVKKDGSAKLEHKFNDQFDLRSNENRSLEYNAVDLVFGFLYHDIAGGNDLMRIKADWNNDYTKDQIDWKANSDKRMKELMEKMQQRQDSLRNEWNKADEWNRNTPLFGN